MQIKAAAFVGNAHRSADLCIEATWLAVCLQCVLLTESTGSGEGAAFILRCLASEARGAGCGGGGGGGG